MNQCPRCGARLEAADSFCAHCGLQLRSLIRPAGFWIRVLATILDGVALLPIAGLLALSKVFLPDVASVILSGIPGLIYKPLMESRYGATLGKMVCGIMVVDYRGQRPGPTTAIMRALPFIAANIFGIAAMIYFLGMPGYEAVKTFSGLMPFAQKNPFFAIQQVWGFIVMLNCLVVAIDVRKRAVHDMIAGTFCIYRTAVRRALDVVT